MTDSQVWLAAVGAVVLLLGFVVYTVVKRNGSVSTEAQLGDARLKIKTAAAPAPPPGPAAPSATMKVGSIESSTVDNLAAGSASLEAKDIRTSDVRNEAGRKG